MRAALIALVSGRPVDLGVGLAEVERLEVPRVHQLLPQSVRVGELHERRRRGMGEPLLGELDSPQVLERRGIATGAVADQEARPRPVAWSSDTRSSGVPT